MADRHASWVRDHLANERTLLAWVRTAIAFMAFGMGIAKLGMLMSIDASQHPELAEELPSPAVSQAVGAALVAIGGLLALLGGLQTRRWSREVAGEPPSAGALIVAVGVAVLTSIGLLVYLLA